MMMVLMMIMMMMMMRMRMMMMVLMMIMMMMMMRMSWSPLLDGVIPPPTAHQVAPVHPLTVYVAHPASGAQGSYGVVGVAVVGALLYEHQVVRRGYLEVPAVDLEAAGAGGANPGGRRVLALQVIPNFPEWCELLPAGDEGAGARHPVALARHLHVRDHRPAPGLIVVQVHQLSAPLHCARPLLCLPLADVHKVLSKFVSILHVVTTSTPDPLVFEVVWPLSIAAATTGQLTVPAAPADAVDHPGTGHRVGEGGFAGGYGEDGSEDGGVVHCGAVPPTVAELELALPYATPGPPAHMHHVVGVQHAQLLLTRTQPLYTAAEGAGGADAGEEVLLRLVHHTVT